MSEKQKRRQGALDKIAARPELTEQLADYNRRKAEKKMRAGE